MDKIFKFICCGNVDDGKSTLIGRLLLNTDSVKKDQLSDAQKASEKNGLQKVELAFLLDGLLDERAQQITIDVAHRYFDYDNTRFHILDCPGHKQYTKNMAIAAAQADAAVIVIDVLKGIQEQTVKHLEICSLFQIKKLCICITKCDLLEKNQEWNWDEINLLTQKLTQLLSRFNFDYSIIPVSSTENVNIDKVLEKLVEYKDTMQDNEFENIIHIQDCRFFNGKRYYWTKFNKKIDIHAKYKLYPENTDITLLDMDDTGLLSIKENIDISRGHCISAEKVIVSDIVKHYTIWFEEPAQDMLLKHGTKTVKIINAYENSFKLQEPIVFNNITEVKNNGFAIIIDNISKRTIGCAVFLANESGYCAVSAAKGRVYWFTGLSCSGKTTLAKELLSAFSIKPILLDADDIRKGINSDLGYSKEDRIKNVDRIAQMANLLASQGFNVIVTCISKEAEQRAKIKELIGPGYVEIFVDRSIENCQKYDTKGLYKSISTEKMVNNYQKGQTATLTLDTNFDTLEQSRNKMFEELKKKNLL